MHGSGLTSSGTLVGAVSLENTRQLHGHAKNRLFFWLLSKITAGAAAAATLGMKNA
jgi:hypothetical protein